MKRLFYIVCYLLLSLALEAQTVNGITNVPDTSYNLQKEFEKVKKQHSSISLPVIDAAVVEERNVNYIRTEKRNLQLDAFYTKQKKKVPAIIIIHGGGWRSGNRTQHHALAQALTAKGYACFTPEYRLSTEAYYPAAVQDVKAVVQWVKTNAKKFSVDTNKIVVMGFSAGGQLAALVGNTNGYQKFEPVTKLKASTNVQAIVDLDGTLSFIHTESSETKPSPNIGASEYWLGYNTTENPELWKEASPLSHAGAHSLPTLFLNSSVERMHAGREDYISILQQHKIYTEVHTFENSPHSFCLFEPWFTPTVNYITGFLQNFFPMRITKTIYTILFVVLAASTQAQEFMPLWPAGKMPNYNGKKVTDSLFNERIWRVATPGMYSFLVPKSENKGTAVLIVPGGGYERLSYIYNGFNFAKWYNSIGVNVFILIHRLPHQQDLISKQIGPVQDAQRAMRIIRANAAQWNIKTDKVGVMGVSAGGHVASTLGTHAKDESNINDSLTVYSYRPDFMVLLSPVITMGEFAHGGSKKNFLGADTTKANIESYSGELQVSSFTPPAFLVHAQNDSTVKAQNSVLFYQALLNKKINASLHVFPQGGHGIRLDDNPGSTDQWMNLLEAWLKEMSFILPIPFK